MVSVKYFDGKHKQFSNPNDVHHQERREIRKRSYNYNSQFNLHFLICQTLRLITDETHENNSVSSHCIWSINDYILS